MDPNTDTINTMNTMGPWGMNIKGRTVGKWMIYDDIWVIHSIGIALA